jgi:hypothetical protein
MAKAKVIAGASFEVYKGKLTIQKMAQKILTLSHQV